MDFHSASTALAGKYYKMNMDAIAKIKKRASTGCDGGGTSRGCYAPCL